VTLKRIFTARFKLGLSDPPEMVKIRGKPQFSGDRQRLSTGNLALQKPRKSRWCCSRTTASLPIESGNQANRGCGAPLAKSLTVLLGNYNGTPSRFDTALGWHSQSNYSQTSRGLHSRPGKVTTFLLEDEPVPRRLVLSTPARGKDPGSEPSIFRIHPSEEPRSWIEWKQEVNYEFAPHRPKQNEISCGAMDPAFSTSTGTGTYRHWAWMEKVLTSSGWTGKTDRGRC